MSPKQMDALAAKDIVHNIARFEENFRLLVHAQKKAGR